MNAAALQLAALSGKPHMGARLWDLYPDLIGSERRVELPSRHG